MDGPTRTHTNHTQAQVASKHAKGTKTQWHSAYTHCIHTLCLHTQTILRRKRPASMPRAQRPSGTLHLLTSGTRKHMHFVSMDALMLRTCTHAHMHNPFTHMRSARIHTRTHTRTHNTHAHNTHTHTCRTWDCACPRLPQPTKRSACRPKQPLPRADQMVSALLLRNTLSCKQPHQACSYAGPLR